MAHILVVDDDSSISDNLRMLLESQGYDVTVCNDGKSADVLLQDSPTFDLLMLDWDLPFLNGPQILERYRTRGGLTPALMLTGKREVESKEEAFDAGADDYLTKPFSLREVAARVKAMLRRSDQMRESLQAAPAPEILDLHSGDPYAGSIFAGRYKLADKLGEGGTGTVYGAVHLGLNRPVAVKFLHSFLISQSEARLRFEREAKTLSEIKHPSIVEVFDFGIEKGQPFIVLERVQGVPLSRVMAGSSGLKLPEALKIFEQICDAMEVAHKAGIIHRDLKPENILVDSDAAGNPTVKIIDMGLAKSAGDNLNLTEAGITLGTAFYMSPEQCQGKNTDARSDVYSMGCLMYEVLTGKPPFDGSDHMQIFMKHINEQVPKFGGQIPDRLKAGRLEGAVLKALEKSPSRRHQSFAELKKALPIKGWF